MALKSRIPQIIAGLDGAQRRAVQTTAVAGVAIARRDVAKDTTSLMRTIRNEDGPSPLEIAIIAGDPSATNIRSGEPVTYAPDVEYGTAKQRAQPFMTPMAAAIRPMLAKNIAAEIKALVKR